MVIAGELQMALRRARWRAAALALGLGAAATGTLHADGVRWFSVRGPHCPIGACLGPLWCPGCGLLRGAVAALRLDLGAAVQAHPGAPLVAALLPLGLLCNLDILRRRSESAMHSRLRRSGRHLFAGAVLLGWLLRPFLVPHLA